MFLLNPCLLSNNCIGLKHSMFNENFVFLSKVIIWDHTAKEILSFC